MKITCDIIKDILPLYAEHMVSEASERMVEEHLSSCESCRKYLEEIRAPEAYTQKADKVPVKKLKSLLIRKRMQAVIISVFISFALAVIIGANLTAPGYFPYSDDIVSLKEGEGGIMYAVFADNVSGYRISTGISDDKEGYVYHIVAWDSIWDRYIVKNDSSNAVLNPNGEKIAAVYYYQTNGSGEILLYGEQQNPGGTIIKQPNLALLAGCAAIILLACAVLLLIFRKDTQKAQAITSALLLPVSYLLSHFLVKGFSYRSFSSSQYFWKILLYMFPVYGILFLIVYFSKFRKSVS